MNKKNHLNSFQKLKFKLLIYAMGIFFFFTNTALLKAQCTITKLGLDIDGEADLDLSGYSLATSSDGLTVAIGAYRNAGGGSTRGHVRIYKNISGTWTQQGLDIDGEANDDWSGFSVSLSADGLTVAIGAPFNKAGGGFDIGHVRVYKNISGTWTQLGADIDGESKNDWFGFSVSLSADGLTVAIGAKKNAGGGTERGHVRIYNYTTGNWTQQGLDIDGETNDDESGTSVALSLDGSTVAIGALDNAGGGTKRGHVRVYKLLSGNWTQLGIDIDGEADNDMFGYSISISADGLTVAIGAPDNNNSGYARGHVRIFKNVSGTWTQLGADIDGETDNDKSGFSISLSADGLTVAIGSIGNAGGGTKRGYARIFKINSGIWTQLVPNINGETNNDQSGNSVSISADGLTIAISASGNYGSGYLKGHVRVYQLNCPTCDLSSALPTTTGTYTSYQTGVDGAYTCFCDSNNNLLFALDTTGTGAVIPNNGISLQIGSATPTSWNNAGGIITNPNGGVLFNRKWDVTPTTQPTSPLKVKFFFTQAEYDSVRVKLSTMGTTITSPTQLEMYKLFTSGFGDPHAVGASGIVLMNGGTASLNNWVYTAFGTNHSAEFLVSSFSGGGGGAGAGAIPLPLEFISFTAKGISNTSALLKWQTASVVNTNYFEVERSLNGVNFIKVGTVNANGINTGNYQYLDNTITTGTTKAFYRIIQVDVNGKSANTNIQLVQFNPTITSINVYPNPFYQALTLNLQNEESANVTIVDATGKIVFKSNVTTANNTLNLTNLASGIYNLVVTTNGIAKHVKIIKI